MDNPYIATSSRNSEVIHAGLYYPPDSFKAQFCVEGKRMMYDYLSSRGISHKKCGKLIVATQQHQMDETLPRMHQRALDCGVPDVQLLSEADARYLEPELDCVGALWSTSTGVLDSHSFMLNLLGDAQDGGTALALNTTLEGATVTTEGLEIKAAGMALRCRFVVNCAGLWAHRVASFFHGNTDWKPPRQYFAKGNYFRLSQTKSPFQTLVYPVPQVGGLGVHATIDWAGTTTKFGPDVEWLHPDISDPDGIDYGLDDSSRASSFYEEIRKYWPALPDDALEPDYTGVRPKLVHPWNNQGGTATSFSDFRLCTPNEHGVPGLYHLLGIESPGLTSSLAIAQLLATRIQNEWIE